MSGSLKKYDPDSYYPSATVYDHLGTYTATHNEDKYWHENLESALDTLEGKMDSPRLRILPVDIFWHRGFEDRELKRLLRSLLALRVLLDDMKREEKEHQVWKVQHRHLKDLLCELDDVFNDIALRAAPLKDLFQSQSLEQVSQHPYLTEKLVQINRLIQELDDIAAEIKSIVLPEFNTSWPNHQRNARSSQAATPPAVSPVLETLVLHIATLTTSLARMEDKVIRMERNQETSAENMRRMYESLSHFRQMSGQSPPAPPPPPIMESDSSDSE